MIKKYTLALNCIEIILSSTSPTTYLKSFKKHNVRSYAHDLLQQVSELSCTS